MREKQYQLVDVTIVTTDGKHADFIAVVDETPGELSEVRGHFEILDAKFTLINFTEPQWDGRHEFLFQNVELLTDLREACEARFRRNQERN